MKLLLTLMLIVSLAGCSTISNLFPNKESQNTHQDLSLHLGLAVDIHDNLNQNSILNALDGEDRQVVASVYQTMQPIVNRLRNVNSLSISEVDTLRRASIDLYRQAYQIIYNNWDKLPKGERLELSNLNAYLFSANDKLEQLIAAGAIDRELYIKSAKQVVTILASLLL